MKIRLKFLGILSYLARVSERDVYFDYPITVEEALSTIAKDYSEDFQKTLFEGGVPNNYLILVNDKNVSTEQNVRTMLKDGDELAIIPVAGGG